MTEQHEAIIRQPPHQQTQQEVQQVADRAGITYLAAGDPAAVPVLFLHGVAGAARVWGAQLAAFGATHRAVAWDMPGYAGSVPLPLVSVEALAAALAGFIAELGLERPVLVGHSLGGMVALRLLAKAPGAARALVLAQTSAAFGNKDPAWAEAFVSSRLGPLDAGKSLAELAGPFIAGTVGDAPDPAGVALAGDCLARVPESTYRDMVLALPGFDQRAALPGIAVPVLVLAGSKDRATPVASMEQMARDIPGARFTVVDGAGHLAHVERPDAFNAALRAFLAEVG